MNTDTPTKTTSSITQNQFQQLWQQGYDKYDIPNFEFPAGVNNLIELLQPSIDKNSDTVAIRMGSVTLSYAQLDHTSRQFASFLQSKGYEKGTRIAVQLPNILQYPAIILGCLRAGMILVNVNPLYTSYELAHQLTDSGAEVLVIFDVMSQAFDNLDEAVKSQLSLVIACSMDVIEGVGNDISLMISSSESMAFDSVENLITSKNSDKKIRLANILSATSADNSEQVDLSMDDIALLQYTGGTTGKAKGAMLTHGNLVANVVQGYSFFGEKVATQTDAQVRMLNPLPLYHIFSFTVCGLLSIFGGWEDILITNPRDMDTVIDSIEEHQPHIIPSVNTLFAGMLNHPKFATLNFSQLLLAIGGGTAIIADIAKNWKSVTGITINEGYGLSEAAPVAAFSPFGVTEFTSTVGLPLAGTLIKVLDTEDNECGIGDKGEVCIKGPQIMLGYWQMDNTEVFTTDGYFRSGDIGYVCENGNVKLVDRKKDMILVSGFNVYPNEIEAVLTEYPKVLEVAVIGITDEHSGEVPKAFVVKSDESLTVDELKIFVKERLTGYKRPHEYEFISELPKSAVGKILRKELRVS